MNQIIQKPRILRKQYSVQKFSSMNEDLVLNLTISQLRDMKSINKIKKTSICSKQKSNQKNLQMINQPYERKRSNTYYNSLAKTALLFVNSQQNRMRKTENVDIQFNIKNQESLQSNQQSVINNHLNNSINLPNYNIESTMHSGVSQKNISLANQINLVKEYVSEINEYHVKWEDTEKITKIYPKNNQKNMLLQMILHYIWNLQNLKLRQILIKFIKMVNQDGYIQEKKLQSYREQKHSQMIAKKSYQSQ